MGLVIVCWVHEKGAFHLVSVGRNNYRIKHTTTTLWEFLTRKHFWCYVSLFFLSLPPHTECRDENMTWAYPHPEPVWTRLPVKLRHRRLRSVHVHMSAHILAPGIMWSEGCVSLPGACVTCPHAVLARATRRLTSQKVQT